MRFLHASLAIAMVAAAAAASTPVNALPSSERSAIERRQNLIGTITAIDPGRITIRTDSGETVTFSTDAKTAFRRVKPGQTSLSGAETIASADLKVGDRVLVPGGAANPQAAVRQVVVIAAEAIAAKRDEDRSQWQTRGVSGRITAIDAANKTVTVQTRGRGQTETLTVSTTGATKIARYAPDSLRSEDARPAAFADLRVGDQIRVLGDRPAGGTAMTAEEIVSGSVVRAFGTISAVNAAAGEITIQNAQTQQTFTVTLSKNTTVKRIPAEVAANLAEARQARQQRRQARAESTGVQTERRRRQRPSGNNTDGTGAPAAARQRPRNLTQLLEDQPAITISDLKAGDSVMVTGTQGADATRLTAVNVITGGAELIQLMQRPQGRRNMSPGLPGNVGGGNAPTDDEP